MIRIAFWVLMVAPVVLSAANKTETPSSGPLYAESDQGYQSFAVIQLFFPKFEIDPGPGANDLHKAKLHKHIEVQKKAIQSHENQRQALRNLVPDAIGDPNEILQRMNAEIKIEQIKGTDLIKVIVTSGDKRFSRDLANQLTDGYLKTRKKKRGEEGAILHQRAVLGKLIEANKKPVEQDAGGKGG